MRQKPLKPTLAAAINFIEIYKFSVIHHKSGPFLSHLCGHGSLCGSPTCGLHDLGPRSGTQWDDAHIATHGWKKERSDATGRLDSSAPNEAGKTNRVLCTTLGTATDLLDDNLRRLLINGIYWTLGDDVPANADVTLVGNYQPSAYRFNGFRQGVHPEDLQLPASESGH